jgi:hypothetical protein
MESAEKAGWGLANREFITIYEKKGKESKTDLRCQW